jgi:hypothetical protein
MRSNGASELRALALELGAFIEDDRAENAIVPGNGYDESMLIGTEDSLLRLAKMLIEIVGTSADRSTWSDADMEEEEVSGMSVIATNSLKAAFSEFSPVWPLCVYLAPDARTAEALMRALTAKLV